MKVLEKVTIIVFLVVLGAYFAVNAYSRAVLDNTPPVISCDSDSIDVSVSDPESALLQGVTAKDNRDGDLTGSIMIKGVTNLITDDTAKVSYVVFDSSNNMATYTRTVHYTDYEKPRFALSKPLIYSLGGPVTVLDRLTATDSSGEDISDNIRIVSQNINISYEDTYMLTVQVSNSLGDTESVSLPLIINSDSARRQQIDLTSYLVYLNAGDSFNAYNYISSVTDSSGNSCEVGSAAVEGTVDTSTPGVYHVAYSYQTYTVYLTVVVK